MYSVREVSFLTARDLGTTSRAWIAFLISYKAIRQIVAAFDAISVLLLSARRSLDLLTYVGSEIAVAAPFSAFA